MHKFDIIEFLISFEFKMKLASVASALLGAGLLLSAVGGLVMCGIESAWFHEYRAYYKDVFQYRPLLQAVLSCGIFGVLRALASIAAFLVLFVPALGNLPRIVVIVLAAVSAGLYFGEVIPGGMAINRAWWGWRDSENNLIRQEGYRSWVIEYQWRHGLVGHEDPVDEALLGNIKGYEVPMGKYWGGSSFGSWGSGFYCDIDFANSTLPKLPSQDDETKLWQNITETEIIAPFCKGGWNADNLKTAVIDYCTRQNEYQNLMTSQSQAQSAEEWDDYGKKLAKFDTPPTELLTYGTATCILILVETVSFILAATGLGIDLVSKEA